MNKHGSPLVTIMLVAVVCMLLTGLVATGVSAEPAAVSEVFTNALAERDSLPAAEGSLWRFEGPRNLKQGIIGGFGLSPHSGRINEVAIYPRDPQIMYATGATGAVWKTTDGGQEWAARSTGWPIQSATAVAVDPNNASRVFVGTGDYKRLDHVPPFSVGIMRTLDGGLSWEQFGTAEMREYTVSRIVIDPNNSATLFAATGRGSRLPSGQVFRSSNGGSAWVNMNLPDANWDDLEVCDQGIVWASGTRRHNLDGNDPGGASGLLFQSPDGGANWSSVNLVAGGFNLGSAGSRPEVIHIACNPDSPQVFVAVYRSGTARVFSTSDTGAHWSELTSSPVAVGSFPWGHAAFGVTANFLYLGGVDGFRGKPGTGGQFVFEALPGPLLHGDFQCAVPDPTETDAVFLCTDGGLYRHSAQSSTTISLSETLGVTQVYRMDVHPRHGGLIAVGTQDLGDSVSFFGNGNDFAALGEPPNWALVLGGDGRSAAFRQDGSSRVYLAITNGGVARYDGTTRTILQSSDAADSQAPLLFSDDTLFYADTSFLRLLNPETKDASLGTADWASFPFRPGGPPPATIQSLALCPSNTQVIYAGSALGELFVSQDGGENWTELDREGVPPDVPVWIISPSPSNCRDVLLGLGYEGGRTVRNGTNTFHAGDRLLHKADALAAGVWTGAHGGPPVLPHAPVYAVVRQPTAPNSSWFVASDVGVFRTDDGGAHWANASLPLGLPGTLVRDLRLSADGNTLYAGTFGRGVWSMDVARPAANLFGVRGVLTFEGRPLGGKAVVVNGSGRVNKKLVNKLTNGPIVTTAPIVVAESATISRAAASLTALGAESVVLVTPDGSELPTTFTTVATNTRRFSLTADAAAALVGQLTRGPWSFKVTGLLVSTGTITFRLSPSVVSGDVDFEFTDRVSNLTGPDGEYTIEYLQTGPHLASVFDCDCPSIPFELTSHRTNLDFTITSVAIAATIPGASESGTVGRFTISRNGSTANSLTVHYKIAGTARNGVDYSRLTGNVTIPAGSATAQIRIRPVNDRLHEPTETVSLQLAAGTDYVLGRPSAATVRILDNDPIVTPNLGALTTHEPAR